MPQTKQIQAINKLIFQLEDSQSISQIPQRRQIIEKILDIWGISNRNDTGAQVEIQIRTFRLGDFPSKYQIKIAEYFIYAFRTILEKHVFVVNGKFATQPKYQVSIRALKKAIKILQKEGPNRPILKNHIQTAIRNLHGIQKRKKQKVLTK